MQAYETGTSSTRWAEAGVLIRRNAGRKRNKEMRHIFYSLCTHGGSLSPGVIRRGSWLRLMTCLVCSTESVEMLGTGKMTLLTSGVLCVKRRDSRANAPTTPYHSDENLTPLNLIKGFLVGSSCGLCLQSVPTEQQDVLPSVSSQGFLGIMRNCLLTC